MEGFRHHLSKQVAMNILVPLTVALLLSVAAASLFAQDGTAPEGMGSTGWTSASRAQTGAAMSANRSDPEAAPQQPFIATGADLNGAHIAAFENAPQPDDRCLIQMFPNPSFCRAPPCMGGDGLDPRRPTACEALVPLPPVHLASPW